MGKDNTELRDNKMLHGQVKVVSQVYGKDENNMSFCRQLPKFIVIAFGFPTAASIVKTMFKDQNIAGQLMDSDGNIEDFEVGS